MKINSQDWEITARAEDSVTVRHKTTGHVRVLPGDSLELAALTVDTKRSAPAETATLDINSAEQRTGWPGAKE